MKRLVSLLCASWGDDRRGLATTDASSNIIGTIRCRSRGHIGQVQTVRVAAGVRSRGAAAVAAVLVALAARAAATADDTNERGWDASIAIAIAIKI